MKKPRVRHALIMDLDGVLVTAGRGDTKVGREILLAHPDAAAQIREFPLPVVFLTQRTRHEALQLLAALKMRTEDLALLLTADDLWLTALFRRRSLWSLLRTGVRKSLILPAITRRLLVSPFDIAFLDDRPENTRDMAAAGVGLNILAPGARLEGDKLISFDLAFALKAVLEWSDEGRLPHLGPSWIELPPVGKAVGDWSHSGFVMSGSRMPLFKSVRSASRCVRSAVLTLARFFSAAG